MFVCRSVGLCVSVTLALATTAAAQGTVADYERAAGLRRRFADSVFRDSVRPQWSKDGERFWYRCQTGPGTYEFIRVDASTGQRERLFDPAKVADQLEKAGLKRPDPTALPFESLRVDDDHKAAQFRIGTQWWRLDVAAGTVAKTEPPPAQSGQRLTRREGPRASLRTGSETHLTFLNKTDGPVRLFWLDAEGSRREYATIAPNGQHRQHTFSGHVWMVMDGRDRSLGRVEATDDEAEIEIVAEGAGNEPRKRRDESRRRAPGVSPNDRRRVDLDGFNLVLAEKDKLDVPLTTDGTQTDRYEGPFVWSPDSRWLLALRTIPGENRQVTLVESSPRDQLQPKVHVATYAKPGDRLDVSRPVLFDVESRKPVEIDGALFSNPWSVSDFRWRPDSQALRFLFNQRGHQVLRVLEVEAATGKVRPLVEETSPTFIDYAGKSFSFWMDETNELVWMSERDGWCHLYLYDLTTATVKNQITKGEWVVRNVDRVDPEKRQVWFKAGGIVPGQDPYYLHVCRVNLDGTGLTVLTEGDGTHDVQYSPDGRYLVDRFSRVDEAPTHVLRRTENGREVCRLETSDTSRLIEKGYVMPERSVAKGRDEKTDIYGVIYRPTNFQTGTKYPVIEHVYAGPQSAFVPKAFTISTQMQEMAELGFIVVKIDGMGTSHRSKAFHDVCWKNLGDGGFPDRIAWVKAAATDRPEMDLTRVGIYGGSAGGQNALRAMLAHGDFYKAAAADCGCHDNRMDKVWWNELWMGWPIGPHYAEQSNVTQAHRLQGTLMLTVGELDRNVDPASTMQVVNALIQADKDFDLLIVPGAGHGIGESPYAARRRADFFVRSLWNVEPRRK